MLAGREPTGPLGMLSGLGSQRPALVADGLVHARDIQFDLSNRLGQLGDLLPKRAAVRLRLLGTREQLRPAWLRIGHRRTLVPQTCASKSHNPPTLP